MGIYGCNNNIIINDSDCNSKDESLLLHIQLGEIVVRLTQEENNNNNNISNNNCVGGYLWPSAIQICK